MRPPKASSFLRPARAALRRLWGRGVRSHTTQVTSSGGAGTTMLYRFLEQSDARLPEGHDWLPYKHDHAPPRDAEVKDGFRALYVFGDPMNAVLSVFRRGYQHWHAQNMPGDTEAWNDDWDLDDFLGQQHDHFHMQAHFRAWTRARRSYPIMLLRFDALWQHLDEVMAFLGVSSRLQDAFPERRARSSDWREQPAEVRHALEALYGDLREEIEAFPDLQII